MMRRRPAKASHTRRGTLMLQTLVTISLTMVIFALIVGCMHQLLRMNSLMRTSASEGLILARLESSFRRDCRLAIDANVVDGRCSFRFKDGRTVTYAAEGRVVEMKWVNGDESGIDNFRCSKGWRVTIEGTDKTVRLMLVRDASRRTESNLGAKRETVIEGHLGIHSSIASNLEEAKQ